MCLFVVFNSGCPTGYRCYTSVMWNFFWEGVFWSVYKQVLAYTPCMTAARVIFVRLRCSCPIHKLGEGGFPEVWLSQAVLLLLTAVTNINSVFTDTSFFVPPIPTQGNKCVFNMCRGCCKKRAFKETADCPGKSRSPHSSWSKGLAHVWPLESLLY